MASHKTSTANTRGFTLIEMLIVIAIVAMLGAVALFVNLDNYRAEAFRTEVNSLGVALQTARADALNNINQKKHGVAIHPSGYDGYIIFQGDTYAAADHTYDVQVPTGYGVSFSAGSPDEIVFEQLSGSATYTGDGTGVITVTNPQTTRETTIVLNPEGRIAW